MTDVLQSTPHQKTTVMIIHHWRNQHARSDKIDKSGEVLDFQNREQNTVTFTMRVDFS